MRALFSAPARLWPAYAVALPAAFAARGLQVDLVQEAAPETVDVVIYAPGGAVSDFAPFTRAQAVLSLWAGVEKIVGNATLTQPLARMVDPGLRQGMVEWVTGHVLRHHLGIDTDIRRTGAVWAPRSVPLATARRVTVLGLGELGGACAQVLSGLGFRVTGWSARGRDVAGLERSLSGPDGLTEALRGAEIVVTLLPLTPGTADLLDAGRLSLTASGAVIVNPGRGGLIVEADLIAALDRGQIGHATLDVFRTEPLPPDHPFWHHPKVTVTPHIAAETRPETAAGVIAENIARLQAGQPLLYLVDRTHGY